MKKKTTTKKPEPVVEKKIPVVVEEEKPAPDPSIPVDELPRRPIPKAEK